MGCIFCKIIKGEIPCYKVYEDDQFFAFLDIRPTNKGHCLVVPKNHYRWVWDVNEDYSKIVNKIANAQKKAFETSWVVSFVMGEEVPHAHIHLVPRFENDGHGPLINLESVKEFSKEEMQEFATRIKNFL
ncbi:HIT family protein [archaeon]|nr:HIT family protein [archaeon]MBT3451426.1 HIT family protein [archaeon]MBT6869722.1 HIT family protein [archaeon]MBT7192677.1 HIT family protein [archaeon]MBT7380702.1 HIT family protein [archaeon]